MRPSGYLSPPKPLSRSPAPDYYELPSHVLEEIRDQLTGELRIGMGVMGSMCGDREALTKKLDTIHAIMRERQSKG